MVYIKYNILGGVCVIRTSKYTSEDEGKFTGARNDFATGRLLRLSHGSVYYII